MKKLFVLMLSVSLIFAAIHPCFAEDRSQDNQVEYTYFEDGCYIYRNASNELNQIGIKIDMYRQEYRFTPAFAFIQAV